tara:strand:- start:1587 stop:2465 length:879 start_codon:yes stop_codon:yes gene_type:complete
MEVRSPSPFLRRCAADFHGDGNASLALNAMRQHYTTPCSLRNRVSDLRALYKQEHPDGRDVTQVCLTEEELKSARRFQKNARESKLRAAPRVEAALMLSHARETLARCRSVRNVYELTLALLLVTGRRCAEILNGRSKFAPNPSPSKHDDAGLRYNQCIFYGQLKQSNAVPYTIPLLAPLPIVLTALTELRRRQARDVHQLGNDAVSRRYQSGLRQHLKADGKAYPGIRCPHQLRALYACCAHQYFDVGDASLAYFTQRALGHAHIKEADVYNTFQVTLDARHRGSSGRFVI